MHVVITGGSGMIGRHLVASLTGDGHRAVVLSRSPERVEGLPKGATVERWDGADAEVLGRRIEGADAVVHLAGESIAGGRWTDEKKRRIRVSRVRSSRAVAEALKAAGGAVPVLIQASAVGYYGARGDEELTESSPPGDDFLAEVCVEWEEASAGVEPIGVRRALVRTGVVLSLEGGALPRMLLPFKLFAGGPLGDGRQWFPWIHLEDEVGAIRFLLERDDAHGPFNLTAPEPLRNRQFAKVLGKVMGRPSFMPTPGLALRAALGEMATLLLDGQRALPAALDDLGYTFRHPRAERALEDLLG